MVWQIRLLEVAPKNSAGATLQDSLPDLSPAKRRRLVALFALAVFLVCEIVTRGVAAYIAEAWPEKAMVLPATQARALLNLAEKKIEDLDRNKKDGSIAKPNEVNLEARTERIKGQQGLDARQQYPTATPDDGSRAQTLAQVQSLAERALVKDPLNARALRILGQLSMQASDDKRAEIFMHTAVQRSMLESEAVYWMMQKSYDNKNYRAALGYADTLLKTRQEVFGKVMPTLGRIAESDGAGELKQLLASNPAWREGFFSRLSGNTSDARTPLGIFLALKETSAPPTVAELRGYLNLLVERKFFDLAYYTWLQFLPDEQLNKVGYLYNGGFEITPSGLPFDWVWTEAPRVRVEIAARPDVEAGDALFLEFGPGRADFRGVRQLLMLPPGPYQLQGKYKQELVSQRGLQWLITCAGGSDSNLGETLVQGRGPEWQNFELSFRVPEGECAAQYVTVTSGARSASEQFISGTIWFDDLKIVNESVVTPLKKAS